MVLFEMAEQLLALFGPKYAELARSPIQDREINVGPLREFLDHPKGETLHTTEPNAIERVRCVDG